MTSRLIRLSSACLVALVATAAVHATTPAQEPAQQFHPMTGVWKLDEAASENPSGAERPSACARMGGRGDNTRVSGGGVSNADSGGGAMYGGGPGNAALGAEELQRFCGTLIHFYDAPPMMGLQVSQQVFTQLLNPETNFGYRHDIDDKNHDVVTPGGPAEVKMKWDDDVLVREINTTESLKIVEHYSLNEQGQLVVEFDEASSRMVRVPEPKIKRVYVRNQ